jgi:hypothetical protein
MSAYSDDFSFCDGCKTGPDENRNTGQLKKKVTLLQDTERLLLWSRHFATWFPLAAAARNTFPRQL